MTASDEAGVFGPLCGKCSPELKACSLTFKVDTCLGHRARSHADIDVGGKGRARTTPSVVCAFLHKHAPPPPLVQRL